MSVQVVKTREALVAACDEVRVQGRTVGLVPTMGSLHAGHARLIDKVRQLADEVVVTIFVNPVQFGKNEDYAQYPRSIDGDLTLCEARGVRTVFAPSVEEMYSAHESTRVSVGAFADGLCGAKRPGHFEGVATVVAKLFALAGRCSAVFGRKDYQQLKVIERMTADIGFPVNVHGVTTVRGDDGVALSSRNAYLGAQQRERARAIPRALSAVMSACNWGGLDADVLKGVAEQVLRNAELDTEYLVVADPDSLEPLSGRIEQERRVLVALAVRLDGVRLIDNVVLGEDHDPLNGLAASVSPGAALQ